MNKYESVIIVKPNNQEIQETIEKFKKIIEEFSERKVEVEDLGEKKLAYEIRNNKTGYYTLFNFYANPDDVVELERNYRMDDNIMKFIVVRQEEQEYDESEDEEEVQ